MHKRDTFLNEFQVTHWFRSGFVHITHTIFIFHLTAFRSSNEYGNECWDVHYVHIEKKTFTGIITWLIGVECKTRATSKTKLKKRRRPMPLSMPNKCAAVTVLLYYKWYCWHSAVVETVFCGRLSLVQAFCIRIFSRNVKWRAFAHVFCHAEEQCVWRP